MKQPVIFLAFANDVDTGHLSALSAERKAITANLVELENNQYLQLHVEPEATVKDLTRYMTIFKDRISIFHYAGHADSEELFLTDGSANADGIAALLAAQSNLQLVFLNGCSTRQQVDALLQSGIPAVLATTTPIGDESAMQFASDFYLALKNQHSIQKAFDIAAAAQNAKHNRDVVIHRTLGQRPVVEEQVEELPWGLYIAEGKEGILDYEIKQEVAASFVIKNAGLKYNSEESQNIELVQTIAEAIRPYSDAVDFLLYKAQRSGKPPKLRDLRVAIIDAFPTPIGAHLRKLLVDEDISVKRLEKLVNIYTVATDFLAFCMIAQLWDVKVHQPDIKITEAQKTELASFFVQSDAHIYYFNDIDLVHLIGDIFQANEVEYFIPEILELRKSFVKGNELYDAIAFLQEMRLLLNGVIDANEIESFCVQAERHLRTFFKNIGFSASYTLMTVKSIELLKKRHNKPEFKHNLVVLDKLTAAFGDLDDVLQADVFTENQSVLLLRNEEDLSAYLNLSPFLIDENALTGQMNSKIFFFRNVSTKGNVNFVLSANLKDKLEVNRENYPDVRVDLNKFFRDVIDDNSATVLEV